LHYNDNRRDNFVPLLGENWDIASPLDPISGCDLWFPGNSEKRRSFLADAAAMSMHIDSES
jgi:hypothetical protein